MNPIVGRVFDERYVITQLLGRGGMGVVYLAKETASSRNVVIKMISPTLRDDPQSLTRFEREAKRLQEFQHPNIVRFYGFGEAREHGANYLVMEYVDGEVLSEVLRRRRKIPFVEFVPIASQILKGVGYVHSRNVLIRDIKPSNVMLCEQRGRANFVKLLDFGLAKVREGETQITSGFVLGTAGYIAPEVLRGEEVDLRSDVYSLGIMFYLLLAGRLPFTGREQAVLFSQTLRVQPPPLASLLDDSTVPAGFIALVDRCLDKDPERRPADANAVIEEMIDVVPSTLFRLPRVGSSGSHAESWSDSHSEPGSAGAGRRSSSSDRTTLPSAPAITLDVPASVPSSVSAAPRLRRPMAWAAGTLASAGLLVAGLVYGPHAIDGDTPTTVTASVADTHVEAAEAGNDRASASASLRQAERAAARGDAEAAMEAYLDVLEVDPEHALARTGLQRVREMMGQGDSQRSPSASPGSANGEAEPATRKVSSSHRSRSRKRSGGRTSSSKVETSAARAPSIPTIGRRAGTAEGKSAARSPLLSSKAGRTTSLLPVD